MKVVWFHMVVVVWWCEELLQSLGEWGRRRLCAVEERRPLCAMAFSSHYELPFCMALPRLLLGASTQGFFHRKGVLDSEIALRPPSSTQRTTTTTTTEV